MNEADGVVVTFLETKLTSLSTISWKDRQTVSPTQARRLGTRAPEGQGGSEAKAAQPKHCKETWNQSPRETSGSEVKACANQRAILQGDLEPEPQRDKWFRSQSLRKPKHNKNCKETWNQSPRETSGSEVKACADQSQHELQGDLEPEPQRDKWFRSQACANQTDECKETWNRVQERQVVQKSSLR